MVRRADEKELLREKELSSRSPRSPEPALRGGRMLEGLGREERFSGLLLTPSCWGKTEAAGFPGISGLITRGGYIALASFPPMLIGEFL